MLAEKIRESEFGGLAAVARIDAYDPRRIALDGSEQDVAMARGIGDRGQPAQPGLGMTGIGVRVYKAPMRFCAVDPLV